MGLAGTKTKIKIGSDPRNTAWSNDKNRFGHQHLQKMGWKPGQGLGVGHVSKRAVTSHVKVNIRTDNTGLGKKSMKNGSNSSEIDGESIVGLDVFQRLLGRLNGKDQKSIDKQSESKRTIIAHARFGMTFIHGGYLAPEIGKEENLEQEKEKKEKKSKKRGREEKEGSIEGRKRSREDEQVESEQQPSEPAATTSERKKEKKLRKEAKKLRKEEKKLRKLEKDSKKLEKQETQSIASREPRIVPGRLAIRARHIASKRAATQDAKSLNEIFMIRNT